MEERRKISINGLPGWAQVVSTLGFPIIVAMVLLGMFTGHVPSPITTVVNMLNTHVRQDSARTRIIRIMCRHQAMALNQKADECDVKENEN